MFIAKLKYISFKKNVYDLDSLLQDQPATYAVLRYAHDIPMSAFNKAIEHLVVNIDDITDKRLLSYVQEYVKATGVGIVEFTDEFDYSIDLVVNTEEPFGECEVSYDLEVDNDSFNFEYDPD